MNARAKISSKGQLVLPKNVREAYGLGPGSEVEIESAGDTIILRPRVRKSRKGRVYTLDEVAGMLKYEGPPISIRDMDRAIEDEVRRRWHAKGA